MAPRLRYLQKLTDLGFIKRLLHGGSKAEATILEATTEVSCSEVKSEKPSKLELVPEDCPICHDPVGIETPEGILESWVHLYCGHKFGTHCIQRWLQDSVERDPHSVPSCPYCRSVAKHPCGHPVSIPAPRPSYSYNIWSTTIAPTHPHPQQTRRARRRLLRRSRRPLQPSPPYSDPYRAQTVGECRTCAANARSEKKMRQIITPSSELGSTTNSAHRRNGERSTSIKSIFSLKGLRRSSIPAPRSARTGNHAVEDHERLDLCRVRAVGTMGRVPMSTLAHRRRLSV